MANFFIFLSLFVVIVTSQFPSYYDTNNPYNNYNPYYSQYSNYPGRFAQQSRNLPQEFPQATRVSYSVPESLLSRNNAVIASNNLTETKTIFPETEASGFPEVSSKVSGAFSAQDGNYILRWEVEEPYITFTASRRGIGFVGFAISPSGGMMGADIFIAGIDPSGNPFSNDFHHGIYNGQPSAIPDAQNDYQLLDLNENGGYTTAKFRRLLNTGDIVDDHPITTGDQNVLWAIGPPSRILQYHGVGNRGVVRVNLRNPPKELRT